MPTLLKTWLQGACKLSLPPLAPRAPIACFAALNALAFSPLALAQPADDDAWHFSVGIGAASQPKFPGSSETRLGAVPTFTASKGRLQLGALPGAGASLGVGYTVLEEGPWRLGVGVGTSLEKPRAANDSATLLGLGDIEQTTLGTVSGSYAIGAATASATIIGDIGGHQQGTQALLDIAFKARPMDKWLVSAGPGITLMDSQYAQTYYGVTPAQSASSGVASYTASAGVSAVRFGAGAEYELTREWRLGARYSASKLQGDAATSPMAEKNTQTSVGLFANYRF
jgi:outer membrane protein